MSKKLNLPAQELVTFSEKIVELAKNGQFNEISDNQGKYKSWSESLADRISELSSHPEQRLELEGHLKKIHSNLQEAILLMMAHKEQLGHEMSNLSSQKKVHLAYSEFSNQAIESRIIKDNFN